MSRTNIIIARPSAAGTCRTEAVWQYDYGQILKLEGVELPANYEVHFSNASSRGEAVTRLGGPEGAPVPDSCLARGGQVYAWVVLHAGEADGETVYRVTIPVIPRSKPVEDAIGPAEPSALAQVVAALNGERGAPHSYALDGRDLSTVFSDADALQAACAAEDYSRIRIGDYWPVTLNGVYRDYGGMTAPAGTTCYTDAALTDEVGALEEACGATGVLNSALPGCHEDYCSVKVNGVTRYVAWSDCLDYAERRLTGEVVLFEVADINPYWRYGDAGALTGSLPHLLLSARNSLSPQMRMRKLNEYWEGQHIDAFTGDGTTAQFTLSETAGTLGYVYVNGAKKAYTTDYTFSGNKVTFKSGRIPANGAQIRIEWMDGLTPWNGSALYRTYNDPDHGILRLVRDADPKLYAHIYAGPEGEGMRYYGETRTKTNQQGGSWANRGRLFLPTEDEIWGRLCCSAVAAGSGAVNMQQWALYRGGRRHFAKSRGANAARSSAWVASSTSAGYFAMIYQNGIASYYSSGTEIAAAPAFLLA